MIILFVLLGLAGLLIAYIIGFAHGCDFEMDQLEKPSTYKASNRI